VVVGTAKRERVLTDGKSDRRLWKGPPSRMQRRWSECRRVETAIVWNGKYREQPVGDRWGAQCWADSAPRDPAASRFASYQIGHHGHIRSDTILVLCQKPIGPAEDAS
jgi:hypothetical protein